MLRFFKNLFTDNTQDHSIRAAAISEATVEVFLDTVSGKTRETDPVANGSSPLEGDTISCCLKCMHLLFVLDR